MPIHKQYWHKNPETLIIRIVGIKRTPSMS